MVPRFLTSLAMILLSASVLAGDEEAEQACAVSKEVYDLVLRANEAGDELEKTEVPDDFPPDNSADFHECFDSVKTLTDDLWLLLEGAAACESRHPCQQLKNRHLK